jgi:ferredoxin
MVRADVPTIDAALATDLERLDPFHPLERRRLFMDGCVVPEAELCVQCGTCVYNCPMGLDVRRHARLGLPVVHPRCLACGECVRRCPRGALRFAPLPGGAP